MITDFKYALRMLGKAPGFTVIAILTLALGIGANSAIFSVINAVLLRPLSFPRSHELVMIWANSTNEPNGRYTDSFPDFYDYRAQSQSFSTMAAYARAGAVLGTGEQARELEGVAVDGDFFETLGIKPILGRGFTAEEAKVGLPNVVVLSHSVWQRAFASNPAIIGQQVTMAGRSYTVLGIMPPGWKFPVDVIVSEYIMPLPPLTPDAVTKRGSHFLKVIGRLKPGVTAQQAQAELQPIAQRLAQQFPDTNANGHMSVAPLLQDVTGDVRPALLILLGAVVLVLLVACANVANLLLARAAARAREIGVRTALGASRTRLVRQLLVESFLFALLGGAGGLLLAWWGVDVLRALGPRNVPRLEEIHINTTVVFFTFGLAVLSTVGFGLVPALQVSRANVNESLQQCPKGCTGGLHGSHVRSLLVVSQVSLSLLLLAAAGLLIKSFFNLRATSPGFEPTRLLVLDQVIPRTKYSDPEAQRRFYRDVFARLATLPGIEAVSGANPLPFSGNDSSWSFAIAGQQPVAPGNHPAASGLTIVPGYFRTLKVPFRSGRDFDAHDDENASKVAIVNETFVRRFIPKLDAIGQQILVDREGGEPVRLAIIGVVADTKQNQLAFASEPEFYQPFMQNPNRRLWIALRSATEGVGGLQAAVARTIRDLDPDVYVGELQPMTNLMQAQFARPKFNMILLGCFAGVAMILAAIGIYGVIAYTVAQRTKEIGIRMALGAQKIDMLTMILRQSFTVIGIGLLAGIFGALAATRLMSSLLYGVSAHDFWIYAIVTIVLSGAALVATYFPARRAMTVDPMVALRYE